MKTDWAENEVNIYCKKAEANDDGYGSMEYMQECAFAALDAYNLLMDQGHSGASIGITMSILNKLVEGKPLTLIENTYYMWEHYFDFDDFDYKSFQCKRYPALYKKVYNDGRVVYSDTDRWRCYDVGSDVPYTSGLVINALDEMFPITFPYAPHTYRVNCETFLYNRSRGDFDHKAILNYVDANGVKININKYYQETDNGWQEISLTTYLIHKHSDQIGDTMEEEARFRTVAEMNEYLNKSLDEGD